jgi:methionine-gamma-lyase
MAITDQERLSMCAKWDDSIEGRRLHPESLMMGYGYKPEWSEGSLKSPIFQTSTFVFQTAEEGKAFFELAYGLREPDEDENVGLIYSRLNNPDLEILEDRLSLWDDVEAAAAFKSGMAAISTTLWAYLRPGDVLLYSRPIYGGTDHLVNFVLPEFGITTIDFSCEDTIDTIETRLADQAPGKRLGLILIETPANPTNDLIDIAMGAELARRHSTADHRAPVAVDNTFLGPIFQRPLDHGADIVLYSATKFIGGHSDLIAGAALGSEAMLAPVRAMRTFLGTMVGPWTGWLLLRSLETLNLRMNRQASNAARVADFLREHPKVTKVSYLGHLDAGHPQFDLFKRQCLGSGSMIAFEVPGGEPAAFRFLNSLKLVHLAVSLGGTESLAEHPASMTHADVPRDEKDRLGVSEGLVRLSIGVEHPDDLMLDLSQALDVV